MYKRYQALGRSSDGRLRSVFGYNTLEEFYQNLYHDFDFGWCFFAGDPYVEAYIELWDIQTDTCQIISGLVPTT